MNRIDLLPLTYQVLLDRSGRIRRPGIEPQADRGARDALVLDLGAVERHVGAHAHDRARCARIGRREETALRQPRAQRSLKSIEVD